MSLSMFELSSPKFKHILTTLKVILEKAQAYCEEKNIGEEVLPASRLIADMHNLATQVQIVTDQCKGCLSRLSGADKPAFEDNEKTLSELIERLDHTLAYIETIPADQINGTEAKDIVIEIPGATLNFKGLQYLLDFVLPNVYFHYTTAYDILRANGMALSKRDFIGNIF